MAAAEDQHEDRQYALAHGAWRQFHALHLDGPVPSQPEVDARLVRYQRGHETEAIGNFGAATVLLAGIGKVLADMAGVFGHAGSALEVLIFLLTCALLVTVGIQSLTHLRRAVEHRRLAQRIGTESVSWSKIDSMFADTRDPEVRNYLRAVRAQGRPLRRAEAAVLLERSRGREPFGDAGDDAFAHYVRGRSGPTRRDMASALACLLAVAAARAHEFDPAVLVPALLLLGAWAFAGLLGTLLQLVLDPWALRGGGPRARALRLLLCGDVVPQAAVILALVATTSGVAGLAG